MQPCFLPANPAAGCTPVSTVQAAPASSVWQAGGALRARAQVDAGADARAAARGRVHHAHRRALRRVRACAGVDALPHARRHRRRHRGARPSGVDWESVAVESSTTECLHLATPSTVASLAACPTPFGRACPAAAIALCACCEGLRVPPPDRHACPVRSHADCRALPLHAADHATGS